MAFAIRVAYGTHDAQLAAIPAMVREIVAAHPAIYLELYRRFAEHGIQFAHPMSIVRVFEGHRDNGARDEQSPVPQGPARH